MNALFQRDMNNSPRAKVFSRLHSRYFINCLYTEMMTFTNSLKSKWNNEQQFLSFFSSFVKSSNDKVYLFTGIYYIIGSISFFFFLIKSRKSSTQLCAFFLSFDSGANATYVTGFHGLYRLLRNVAYLLPTSNLHFLCISTHLPWQVTYQLPTKYKLKWNFQFMIYVLRDIGFINKYVVDIIVFRIFNMLR